MFAIASQASLHVGLNSELFRGLKTTMTPKDIGGPREEIFREVL
jgi:hypothetical protein